MRLKRKKVGTSGPEKMCGGAGAKGEEFKILIGVDVGKEGENSQTVMITCDEAGKAVLRTVTIFGGKKRPKGSPCPGCKSSRERHAGFGRGPIKKCRTKICLECATLWDV